MAITFDSPFAGVLIGAMDRDEYCTFLTDWIADAFAARPGRRPLVVGLSAPQGAGKTTLTKAICEQLNDRGMRSVGVSIDDFYLTHGGQMTLAALHSGNRFLAHRGLPGTHDIALGLSTLSTLRSLGAGQHMAIPTYDRSAFQGRGDRLPESDWPVVDGPLDIVILEGWMLGFVPVDPEVLADPQLQPVNAYLADYTGWHSLLDALIWLEPDDDQHVRRWRAEAEQKMAAAGAPAMNPEEVAAFVDTFLPAYSTYYPGLRKGGASKDDYLHLIIGADRLPVGHLRTTIVPMVD